MESYRISFCIFISYGFCSYFFCLFGIFYYTAIYFMLSCIVFFSLSVCVCSEIVPWMMHHYLAYSGIATTMQQPTFIICSFLTTSQPASQPVAVVVYILRNQCWQHYLLNDAAPRNAAAAVKKRETFTVRYFNWKFYYFVITK